MVKDFNRLLISALITEIVLASFKCDIIIYIQNARFSYKVHTVLQSMTYRTDATTKNAAIKEHNTATLTIQNFCFVQYNYCPNCQGKGHQLLENSILQLQ